MVTMVANQRLTGEFYVIARGVVEGRPSKSTLQTRENGFQRGRRGPTSGADFHSQRLRLRKVSRWVRSRHGPAALLGMEPDFMPHCVLGVHPFLGALPLQSGRPRASYTPSNSTLLR